VTHYFGGQSNFWAKIAAMSVLDAPGFFTVASLQRYFVRGISMGAIKG
jgi:multiple sugar transport system permease protein